MSRSSLPRTAVIVPWRDKGDLARRRNQEYVVNHLQEMRVGPVVVVDDGLTGDEPFNRSAAYNRGVRQTPDAQVYVFHEADMLLSRYRLVAAIHAATDPGLVVPFDEYWYLSQTDSDVVLNGWMDPKACRPERVMKHGTAVGAVCVVSAETMAAVRCWDEKFAGWGYDDRAMARAFQICSGVPLRYIPGVGVHLWHTPGWEAGGRFAGGAPMISSRERRATRRNGLRWRRYEAARTPAAIRALTAGG